ncbi:MAG TPA: histidinol-phosphatase HisJ [Bacteroidales bacterium]|nr:histidinol-phosphatase HisJ [Bacteroidales bacterium]
MHDKLLFNYHSHTDLSDGKAVFSDYAEEAIQQGFKAIGFSEHTPVPFASSWNMPAEKMDEYIRQIEVYKQNYADKLQIYLGLEVDYFAPYREQILTMASVGRLDYFIGSVHYLGFLGDNEPWCIDTSFEEFEAGFHKIFNADGRKLYATYYEAVIQMIEYYKPTIIGHLDKIKMYNHIHPFFDENEKEYRNWVMQVLEMVQKYNLFIELNMRGFYKHPRQLLYPDVWILKEALRLGIRLIVSSDCHRREELSAGFADAIQVLKEVGYRSVWCLYDRYWQEWSLD